MWTADSNKLSSCWSLSPGGPWYSNVWSLYFVYVLCTVVLTVLYTQVICYYQVYTYKDRWYISIQYKRSLYVRTEWYTVKYVRFTITYVPGTSQWSAW